MIEYLKIKYVFREGRHPNKDLKNSIQTLSDDIFINYFYEYFVPEFSKSLTTMSKEELDEAIKLFIDGLEDTIKDESETMQELILHPDSVDMLIKKIKIAMR
jgi:hypothetical protein